MVLSFGNAVRNYRLQQYSLCVLLSFIAENTVIDDNQCAGRMMEAMQRGKMPFAPARPQPPWFGEGGRKSAAQVRIVGRCGKLQDGYRGSHPVHILEIAYGY